MASEAQHSWQDLCKRTMISAMLSTRFTNRSNICRPNLPVSSSLRLLAAIVLLSCVGLTPEAHSAIYYLSPNGTNSNFTGSSDKPWRTFAFAIPKLKAGDTLILKNGTYNFYNSGYPVIDCSSSAVQNGTSTNPITIKAENERRAFLNGDGNYPAFTMRNCSYWKIEGLRAKSADNTNSAAGRGHALSIHNSNNITLKRLLLTHNNRYVNSNLLAVGNSNNILVEESEFYYFQRHAISFSNTNKSIARRNYFNSRGYRDIAGGFKAISATRGDMGITNYPGSNNIIENNISENNISVASIQATSAAVGNKFLGNISLNDLYGLVFNARGTGNKMPMDTVVENHVSITPTHFGLFARGTKNTQVRNITILGGSSGIIADFEVSRPGDGFYSFFSKNALVHNISTYGFRAVNQTDFSHKFPSSYKPKVNFSPNFNYFNERTDDPKLGTCKVFIPKTSPLKGKGEGGADIGANILYRYEKGVLTKQPLWNVTTGAFPIGAIIAGVNDMAGTSAFDVHKRLNVNANGCTLPAM